jgi:hypothetical protein
MPKWLTSLVLLIAIAGQALAGVCECLADAPDTHSCCKRGNNEQTSIAAKSCCDSDCESMGSQKTPRKTNSEVSVVKLDVKARPVLSFWSFGPKIHYVSLPNCDLRFSNHRLKPPRAPDTLYLRHNSLLI